MLAGAERGAVSAERIAELQQAIGLNNPLPVQYGRFLSGMLRGDLAQSIRLQTSVTEVILERFGFTIQLRLDSLACALQQGITTGVLSVLRPNGWTDDPVPPHGLLRHVDTPFGAVPDIDIRLALSARRLAPYDPLEQGLPPTRSGNTPVQQAPSNLDWFGTVALGHDVLSRILAGDHISLALGFISVSIGLVAGPTLDLVAGFYGGWDGIVMRAMDALLALLVMLLVLVVIAALGTSIQNAMIAVGIAIAPQYARLTRGLCLTIRELACVEAAHVVGSGPVRPIFRHFLPNIEPPLNVLSTLQIGRPSSMGRRAASWA